MKAITTPYLIAGGALVAVLAYVLAGNGKKLGEAIGGGAVDLVNGVVGGAVTGIGEAVGIPKTEPSACERAKAAGDTWAASFDCPAGDFLNYWWNK